MPFESSSANVAVLFSADGQNNLIERLCSDLDDDILSKARSFDESKEPGRSIHSKIFAFHVRVRACRMPRLRGAWDRRATEAVRIPCVKGHGIEPRARYESPAERCRGTADAVPLRH